MKAREIGAAVLNAKDDEEMTRLIHSMTDYQKEIMIKTLVSIVKKAFRCVVIDAYSLRLYNLVVSKS